MREPWVVLMADGVLIVLAIEALLLAMLDRRIGAGATGPAGLPWVANLGAGACLLLALRASSSGWQWPVVALCLAIAGVLHLCDMVQRWRWADRFSPSASSPR